MNTDLNKIYTLFLNSHPRIRLLILKRDEGKKREREALMWEKTLIGCLLYIPRRGMEATTFWCMGQSSNHLSHLDKATYTPRFRTGFLGPPTPWTAQHVCREMSPHVLLLHLLPVLLHKCSVSGTANKVGDVWVQWAKMDVLKKYSFHGD